MRNRFALAFFGALVACHLPGCAVAASQAGQVLAVFGTSFVETGGGKQLLQLGSPVSVGDTVEVPAGAKLKLRMIDGSVVSIASGSRLTIADYRAAAGGQGRDARLSLAEGLLRAVVSASSGPSHFEVNTATGVAAVRSTDWFIDAAPDCNNNGRREPCTQVGVKSGFVVLTSTATRREVTIWPGAGTRVFQGLDPAPPRRWQDYEFEDVIRRTDIGP